MNPDSGQQLAALMFTDIVGSVALQNRLGTEAYTRFIRRHDEIFKECLSQSPSGEILNETGDGFLVKFSTPTEAVNTALRLQAALHAETCEGEPMRLCIGLHMGSVTEMEEGVRGEKRAVGMAINLAARVMDLAESGQILMTRAVFDEARQFVRVHPNEGELPQAAILQWPAHGRYLFKGNDEPLEIYEVGAEGLAPLAPPEDSGKAKRAVAADEEDTLGWRPGVGLAIPRMEDWVIEKQLGTGGFGEVWLAKHLSTKEERVFKFCFDPERLRSFRRELTLFRLLRDALGKRNDIAALYDVSIEMPPFYLESEFVPQGNLGQWAESQGGLTQIAMETRLDILARTARAVDAAHSVGIVHKDIKPSNVLISIENNQPRPRLADFGIGTVTDSSALSEFGITQSGFTQSIVESDSSTHSMTQLYAPPEYLVGKEAHPKGDIYSLGVMLYQLAAGDLKRPMASGWRRDIPDILLAEIIEGCVDVDPARRLESAGKLAERLETLEERRAQHQERQRLEQLAVQARRRRRALVAGGLICAGLIVLSAILGKSYIEQKRLTAEQVALREEADNLRLEARQLSSRSDFLLASRLLKQHRASDAVAFLARSLRTDPTNRAVATTLFTTLANHRFPYPAYPFLSTHDEDAFAFERLFTATFNADSTEALALNSDKRLVRYDLESSQILGEPFLHPEEEIAAAFYVEDEQRILAMTTRPASGESSANRYTRLRLWDTQTGRLIRQEPQGDSKLQSVTVSEDNPHWITAEVLDSAEDLAQLTYWDLQDMDQWHKYALPWPEGPRLFHLERTALGNRFVCLSILSDGRRCLRVMNVGDADPTQWKDFQWETVATLGRWNAPNGQAVPKVSDNEKFAAVAQPNGSVSVFDLDSKSLHFSIDSDDQLVQTMAFSPSSRMLALGFFDIASSRADVWDITQRERLPLQAEHDAGVTVVAFSPDGTTLMTGSVDGTARLWDLHRGTPAAERMHHKSWIANGRFSDDGSRLQTVDHRGDVAVWELGGMIGRPVPLTSGPRHNWVLDGDGHRLAGISHATTSRHQVVIRDIGETSQPDQVVEFDSRINSYLLTKNGGLLARRNDGVLEQYDLETGERQAYPVPRLTSLITGDCSDDGRALVASNIFDQNRREFRFWRLGPEDAESYPLVHDATVLFASVSRDGSHAAISTRGPTVLWDLQQDPPTARPIGSTGITLSLALNGDGTRLLTGTVEGTVRLWATGKARPLTRPFQLVGQVIAVAFSRDERFAAALAARRQDGREIATVSAWDLELEEAILLPVDLVNTRESTSEGIVVNFNAMPQIRFDPGAEQLVCIWNDVASAIPLHPSSRADSISPNWLPDLAEGIAGRRLDRNGKLVRVEDTMRQRLFASAADHLEARADARERQWAEWFQRQPGERPLTADHPYWTSSRYQALLRDFDNVVNVFEWLQIAPGDPAALALAARHAHYRDPNLAAWYLDLAAENHASSPTAGGHAALAQAHFGLNTALTPNQVVQHVGGAIELDPNDLVSRYTLARELNRLAKNQSPDRFDYGKAAAVYFEILAPLGWRKEFNRAEEGWRTGSEWRFSDEGVALPETWVDVAFDDDSWRSGQGSFGFGDGREKTTVRSGPILQRHTTTYFRKSFTVEDRSRYPHPNVRYQRDDGVVMYLNGVEFHRVNMPLGLGPVTSSTFANQSAQNSDETEWHVVAIDPQLVQPGSNVLAIELHQNSRTSSDLHFELEFTANAQSGWAPIQLDALPSTLDWLENSTVLTEALRKDLRTLLQKDLDSENASLSAFHSLGRAAVAHLREDNDLAHRLLDSTPDFPSQYQRLGEARHALAQRLAESP